MHNIYIVAIKLKSSSHDQQKCKIIKTLVLLVCQLIQLYKPDLEKDSVHINIIIIISRVFWHTTLLFFIHELLPQPEHLNYELGVVILIKYNYNI